VFAERSSFGQGHASWLTAGRQVRPPPRLATTLTRERGRQVAGTGRYTVAGGGLRGVPARAPRSARARRTARARSATGPVSTVSPPAALASRAGSAEDIVTPRCPRTRLRYRYGGRSPCGPVTSSPRTRCTCSCGSSPSAPALASSPSAVRHQGGHRRCRAVPTALFLGQAAPDAVRLPGSQREREAPTADQATGADPFRLGPCSRELPADETTGAPCRVFYTQPWCGSAGCGAAGRSTPRGSSAMALGAGDAKPPGRPGRHPERQVSLAYSVTCIWPPGMVVRCGFLFACRPVLAAGRRGLRPAVAG
jgi:hypothetical protein